MFWWEWHFGFWPLLPLFWIGTVIFLCWGVGRWLGWRNRPNAIHSGYRPVDTPIRSAQSTASEEPSALEILRRRYARGEIDTITFDQMCERLESSARIEGSPYS